MRNSLNDLGHWIVSYSFIEHDIWNAVGVSTAEELEAQIDMGCLITVSGLTSRATPWFFRLSFLSDTIN